NDLALLLARLQVQPSGAPAPPNDRRFWAPVFGFESVENQSSAPAAVEGQPIDAAWLAEVTDTGTWFSRGDRFDQLSFGQRMFGDIAEDQWPAAIGVLQALPRQRMLMFGLERMGIREPALFFAASQRARAIKGDPSVVFWTLAQFQGALALIARMTDVG